MRAFSILFGLLFSTTAAAAPSSDDADRNKIRVKTSTPLYIMNSTSVSSLTVDQSGVTLFTQPARVELSYQIAQKVELGAMVSFGGVETDTGDSATVQQTDQSILFLHGIYNFKLAKKVRGFVQPIAGISYQNDKMGDLMDTVTQSVVFGGDLGARFIVTEGITFDLAAEYLSGSGTMTDISDNEVDVSSSSINLRTGLGVRF